MEATPCRKFSSHPTGAAQGLFNGIAVEGSGKMVFVAGQLGANAQGQIESDDFGQQIGQAFRNVVRVVQEAGGRPTDIVR